MDKKEQYDVIGMHCAACSAAITNTLKKQEGISSVEVNLLKNKAIVCYDDTKISSIKIKKAVSSIGYKFENEGKTNQNSEIKKAKTRLVVSLILGIPLITFVMLAMFKVPPFFDLAIKGNGLYFAVFQIVFTIPIVIFNFHYFLSGFKSLFKLHPNMDSLISIGSFSAIIYSLYNFIGLYITKHIVLSSHEVVHAFYFETASMILVIVTIGKYLEAKAKKKASQATYKLLETLPNVCNLVKDNEVEVVSVNEVKLDDVILVKPGEKIPLDGIIIDGVTFLDESVVTGESMPVEKRSGDTVTVTTLNLTNPIKVKVTSVSGSTWLDSIVKLVDEASVTKAPIERMADKISGIFVPIIMGIALLTFIIWLLIENLPVAFKNAISVLVIACPCSLGLATPTSIVVGMGKGSEEGILFKNAESLELLSKIKTMIFDKTGTLTLGKPKVVNINKYNDDFSFEVLYALENYSSHPLAIAICDYTKALNISLLPATKVENIVGGGISGYINNQKYYIGSANFIKEKLNIEISEIDSATTKVYLVSDKVLGCVEIMDEIKPSSPYVISELNKDSTATIIATGDNEKTALLIKDMVGSTDVKANLKPEDKQIIVKEYQKQSKVAFIGDGVNDSVALTTADIGISIGSGTDIAKTSADVILVKNDLIDLLKARYLSKRVLRNIKQNLFWALIYNSIALLLTTGLYQLIFGKPFNPMFGALAMSLSSVTVVTNALRLRKVNLQIIKYEGDNTMFGMNKKIEKVLKVEGMMCANCEKHVNQALLKVKGVKEAIANKDLKEVKIILNKEIEDEVLIKAIEEAGYHANK